MEATAETEDEGAVIVPSRKGAGIISRFQAAIHEAGLLHVVQGLGKTNKAGHELIVRDQHGVVKTVRVPHNKEPTEIGVRILDAFDKKKARPKTGQKPRARGPRQGFGDGGDF